MLQPHQGSTCVESFEASLPCMCLNFDREKSKTPAASIFVIKINGRKLLTIVRKGSIFDSSGVLRSAFVGQVHISQAFTLQAMFFEKCLRQRSAIDLMDLRSLQYLRWSFL